MLTANKTLETSLDKFTKKAVELMAHHSSELEPIREALAHINSHTEEDEHFKKSLVKLAREVIRVRNASPVLRELPVPPYDLWLPFKAYDLTPSDKESLESAERIFNHKVSEMELKLRAALGNNIASGEYRGPLQAKQRGA